MHLPGLIVDLALVLTVAAAVGIIFRFLKQPLVLGYLLAGILVGPQVSLIPTVRDPQNIQVWAELGIIFLLFVLGLEFSFRKLFQVGRPALVAATVEVLGMGALGIGIGHLLNWPLTQSLFLGGMLAISSTTIIIKAFQENGIKTQSFASLVYGILVIEDLYAILIIALLTTLGTTTGGEGSSALQALGVLTTFLVVAVPVGLWFIPRLLKLLRHWMNDEMRVILSLALCLALVVVSVSFGLSAALGAFLMGAFIGETFEGERIERFLKPIRDLFGAIFFTSVGMLVNFSEMGSQIGLIVGLSVMTIAGKVFFSWIGARLGGQQSRVALQAGLSLGQIGEFSFIIATLGVQLQVVSPSLYPLGVAVALITTFTTPYLIRIAAKIQQTSSRWKKSSRPRIWDGHLIELEIHPHFQHAGQMLQEIKLREKFGISLVAITRGDRKIISPTRHDRLMPFDQIVVHGTDTQLGHLEKFLSGERYELDALDESQYLLEAITVTAQHEFCGKRIRDSEIREKTHGLILGIERKDEKILNPDSGLIIQEGDLLWIYGCRDLLRPILKTSASL